MPEHIKTRFTDTNAKSIRGTWDRRYIRFDYEWSFRKAEYVWRLYVAQWGSDEGGSASMSLWGEGDYAWAKRNADHMSIEIEDDADGV